MGATTVFEVTQHRRDKDAELLLEATTLEDGRRFLKAKFAGLGRSLADSKLAEPLPGMLETYLVNKGDPESGSYSIRKVAGDTSAPVINKAAQPSTPSSPPVNDEDTEDDGQDEGHRA